MRLVALLVFVGAFAVATVFGEKLALREFSDERCTTQVRASTLELPLAVDTLPSADACHVVAAGFALSVRRLRLTNFDASSAAAASTSIYVSASLDRAGEVSVCEATYDAASFRSLVSDVTQGAEFVCLGVAWRLVIERSTITPNPTLVVSRMGGGRLQRVAVAALVAPASPSTYLDAAFDPELTDMVVTAEYQSYRYAIVVSDTNPRVVVAAYAGTACAEGASSTARFAFSILDGGVEEPARVCYPAAIAPFLPFASSSVSRFQLTSGLGSAQQRVAADESATASSTTMIVVVVVAAAALLCLAGVAVVGCVMLNSVARRRRSRHDSRHPTMSSSSLSSSSSSRERRSSTPPSRRVSSRSFGAN